MKERYTASKDLYNRSGFFESFSAHSCFEPLTEHFHINNKRTHLSGAGPPGNIFMRCEDRQLIWIYQRKPERIIRKGR